MQKTDTLILLTSKKIQFQIHNISGPAFENEMTMSQFILHHHDPSPYADKIRKLFAVKELDWLSVQVSMVMPRPDMTALTGGYRRIPTMQKGADIFCDTLLCAQIIEQLHPEPPLYTSGQMANFAMQKLGDAMFRPGAALSLYENAEFLPEEVVNDRRAYFTFLDFDRFETDAPHFRSQFRAYARMIETQLGHGKNYLLGDALEWADINAYFNIWMAGGNIPSSQNMFADMVKMKAWFARIEAIEDKGRQEISAQDALEIARQANPEMPLLGAHQPDESGIDIGTQVEVFADDYGGDKVRGELRHCNDQQIIIFREDTDLGEVAIHFPRLGFRIEKA